MKERGFNPASKGQIEAVVKFTKYNFAEHRIFYDIVIFNKTCQACLERTGYGKIHGTTKKLPKEVFALENEHILLIPNLVNELASNTSLTYVVRKDNTVLYRQNRYGVPKGTYAPELKDSSYQEFLKTVLEGEIKTREKRSQEIRLKNAGFLVLKTFDDFDFDFQKSILKKIPRIIN